MMVGALQFGRASFDFAQDEDDLSMARRDLLILSEVEGRRIYFQAGLSA
jgi:hypothetical protein